MIPFDFGRETFVKLARATLRLNGKQTLFVNRSSFSISFEYVSWTSCRGRILFLLIFLFLSRGIGGKGCDVA